MELNELVEKYGSDLTQVGLIPTETGEPIKIFSLNRGIVDGYKLNPYKVISLNGQAELITFNKALDFKKMITKRLWGV